MSAAPVHRTLVRQLRRLGIEQVNGPSAEQWPRLLALLSATYCESDDERYLLERSIEISSREMRALHDSLRRQARQDRLTGLFNRAGVLEQLDVALHSDDELALLFIDLDGFKGVNDTYGHAAGDALLLAVAGRISSCFRSEDIVGRMGGDEFVVVCSNFADSEVPRVLGERVTHELSQPFDIFSVATNITCSIGLALSAAVGRTAEDLLTAADAAMYCSKAAGKNQLSVATR